MNEMSVPETRTLTEAEAELLELRQRARAIVKAASEIPAQQEVLNEAAADARESCNAGVEVARDKCAAAIEAEQGSLRDKLASIAAERLRLDEIAEAAMEMQVWLKEVSEVLGN